MHQKSVVAQRVNKVRWNITKDYESGENELEQAGWTGISPNFRKLEKNKKRYITRRQDKVTVIPVAGHVPRDRERGEKKETLALVCLEAAAAARARVRGNVETDAAATDSRHPFFFFFFFYSFFVRFGLGTYERLLFSRLDTRELSMNCSGVPPNERTTCYAIGSIRYVG